MTSHDKALWMTTTAVAIDALSAYAARYVLGYDWVGVFVVLVTVSTLHDGARVLWQRAR